MIEVLFRRNASGFKGFKVNGHSGYADRGYDVVCASVSSLTIHTAEMLVSDLDIEARVEQDEKGYLSVELKDTNELSEMMIKALIRSLQSIEEEYSDYLKVEVKE